ncbi:MAG: DUF561 domain-containing protein, partial [Deltaproteobacteria bacterium]|nr:DUF561 domain-containing protein [Deltaproteobacteria bacterium]
MLTATQEIVRAELNAKVPIIVYVSPKGARAASAGVFVTMAAHVAAMAPSTRIGAAHPVTIGGEGEGPGWKWPKREKESAEGKGKKKERKETLADKKESLGAEAMSAKIMQDTIAWVSGIASARKRNIEWAVQSVKESRSSTAEEANAIGVIDLIVESPEALLQAVDGRTITLPSGPVILATKGATTQSIPMTWRQQLLQVLSNPNIAYILMILGFYGLLFEITHPGSWIPGIAGAICLILAFYALQTLPTNYAGLALILLAVALLIAEIKITSYGFLTIAALVALFLGSLMLVHSPAEFMRVSLKVILPVVAATGGERPLCVTVPGRLPRAEQIALAQALQAAGADLLQTEGVLGPRPEGVAGAILHLLEALANTTAVRQA